MFYKYHVKQFTINSTFNINIWNLLVLVLAWESTAFNKSQTNFSWEFFSQALFVYKKS